MSRTLTESDRSALIRLASSMPIGSSERTALLDVVAADPSTTIKVKIKVVGKGEERGKPVAHVRVSAGSRSVEKSFLYDRGMALPVGGGVGSGSELWQAFRDEITALVKTTLE